ncbi:MAG: glycoside hydrolase family 10 protein [Turicibacter sp.]
MEENIKHTQIIMTCQCPYCLSLGRKVTEVEGGNMREDSEKGCSGNFNLIHPQTDEIIKVNNKGISLPNCIKQTKRELRGVWITTVRNTDFPSVNVYKGGKFNTELFKQEYITILNRCKELNLNAVIVQIRPEGDAFYPSKLNPYSEYLTGVQGRNIGLGSFDPLSWMIEETHLLGIEFHAWFNPYRMTPSAKKGKSGNELLKQLASNNYAKLNPDKVYFFNGQLFLDPGIPEVNTYVINSIMEVVQKYNIDAVHLDDYFYPYDYEVVENGKTKYIEFDEVSPDKKTYLKYKKNNETIEQWREQNINRLVKGIADAIHEYDKKQKKSVAFGISPFGIWASAEKTNGVGSNTSPDQLSSMEDYVNSKLWIDEGWLDYILPQNYWSFSDELSPFGEVAYWWDKVVKDAKTQLYMGLGMYLYDEDQDNKAWQDANEIRNQILYLKTLPNVKGYVFFTYKSIRGNESPNTPGLTTQNEAIKLLEEQILTNPTIIPARPWLQYKETKPVSRLKVTRCEEENVVVFEDSSSNNSQYYVIYRAPGFTKLLNLKQDRYIIDVIGKRPNEKFQQYKDSDVKLNAIYTYGVTALSQAQVESSIKEHIFNPKD